MNNAKLKLNLVLGGVCLVATILLGAALHPWLHRNALDEVKEASQRQMATAQAVRSYTSEHIRGLLLRDQTTFHPQSVPSFAAISTMRYLQDAYPGYRYKEVALNPTNPANKASEWEAKIIASFSNSSTQDSFHVTGRGDSMVLHYAKPIRVPNATCLSCHGRAQDAPATMTSKYGLSGGYGWHIGEVVGAQVVSIAAASAVRKANEAFALAMMIAAGSFVLFFALLNWMLSRTVLNPMQTSNAALKRMAEEDALTGVANRRSFMARLQHEVMSANLVNGLLSVVVLDLDHFKRINDQHGHAGGDLVLKEVCVRLGAKVRRSDMIGRLGGEEFAILLPCTDQSGAARLAEHLRSALAAEPVEDIGTVTGSFGVAQLDIEAGETIEALLARADAALYDAKASGRNCVAVASDTTPCVERKSSYPQFLGTKPRRGPETSWPTTV